MSKKNLESLLDQMLDDSADALAREAAEAAEVRRVEAAEAEAQALLQNAENASKGGRLDAIDQLAGLPDEDTRAVLARAAPDDILVVLATASGDLQRRLLQNLSAESVAWVKANLVHMDHVTGAERQGAEQKILKVANELLADGTIGLPEVESETGAEAPDAGDRDLRSLLTQLVTLARSSGAEAVALAVQESGQPLLSDGLAFVVQGAKGDSLRREMKRERAHHEARYAERLRWIEEAVVAIAEGEDGEAFRARVFEG